MIYREAVWTTGLLLLIWGTTWFPDTDKYTKNLQKTNVYVRTPDVLWHVPYRTYPCIYRTYIPGTSKYFVYIYKKMSRNSWETDRGFSRYANLCKLSNLCGLYFTVKMLLVVALIIMILGVGAVQSAWCSTKTNPGLGLYTLQILRTASNSRRRWRKIPGIQKRKTGELCTYTIVCFRLVGTVFSVLAECNDLPGIIPVVRRRTLCRQVDVLACRLANMCITCICVYYYTYTCEPQKPWRAVYHNIVVGKASRSACCVRIVCMYVS